MAHNERRVTHHVVENTAALQRTVPEPGRMRAAVFLCRPREVRPACSRRAARPDELLPSLDVRREELILEIPCLHADALGELHDLLRFGDGAAERLLAGDALQR